jgi:hypothetical protein
VSKSDLETEIVGEKTFVAFACRKGGNTFKPLAYSIRVSLTTDDFETGNLLPLR